MYIMCLVFLVVSRYRKIGFVGGEDLAMQRWAFIQENKKVRKQENKNSTKKAI